MPKRTWELVLLGGASGVGKSVAAARIARATGAFVVEFDDVVAAVQELTTAEQHPALHHFDAPAAPERPEDTWSPERVLALQIATAEALEPAALGVVRNRLTVPVPAVIEGDYLAPAICARAVALGRAAGRDVRAVFLHEGDADRIAANYAAREPASGVQTGRAEVGARYSHWLADEARRHALPVVDCRPWSTLADRLDAALEAAPSGVPTDAPTDSSADGPGGRTGVRPQVRPQVPSREAP
ncbi:AAA family ATPase [Kitasatospora purpeofusca]|uniref:AAA family ATPase n=1 Tax=Kitasatospora purpeofusca TaxID=67352 RepID=A0ABZ1TW20_9ACTN|nr:AAA family ATPase [Kitasatospora purpeofusca]